MGKATFEIHENLEGEQGHASRGVRANFTSVIVQILLLDVVFSLDSVITAVGMVDRIEIMAAAVVMLCMSRSSCSLWDKPTPKSKSI